MRFQVVISLWRVTSCSCIDKIPEVAKTKVSNPKEIFFIKVKTLPRPLKRLIQTLIQTHVYVTMWTYLHNAAQMFMQKRRRGFSNRSSVGAFRNHYDYLQQNSNAFYG